MFSKTLLFTITAALGVFLAFGAQAAVVAISDPGLEDALRTALGKPSPQDILDTDLAGLTALEADNLGIEDLTPLAYCTGLTTLSLFSNAIQDIAPLQGLTALTRINLKGNQIADITPLAGLTGLTDVLISNNKIEDLSVLAGLANLTVVAVAHNKVTSLAPLTELTALNFVDLRDNPTGDIGDVAALFPTITGLGVSSGQIAGLSALAGMESRLVGLNLSGKEFQDLAPVAAFTNLILLRVEHANVSDLTPLANLQQLQSLGLAHNNITNITPLAGLITLNYLDLSGNRISDITSLPAFEGMACLDLSNNWIWNIESLAAPATKYGDSLFLGLVAGFFDQPWTDDNHPDFPLVDISANPLGAGSVKGNIATLENERKVTVVKTKPGGLFGGCAGGVLTSALPDRPTTPPAGDLMILAIGLAVVTMAAMKRHGASVLA